MSTVLLLVHAKHSIDLPFKLNLSNKVRILDLFLFFLCLSMPPSKPLISPEARLFITQQLNVRCRLINTNCRGSLNNFHHYELEIPAQLVQTSSLMSATVERSFLHRHVAEQIRSESRLEEPSGRRLAYSPWKSDWTGGGATWEPRGHTLQGLKGRGTNSGLTSQATHTNSDNIQMIIKRFSDMDLKCDC